MSLSLLLSSSSFSSFSSSSSYYLHVVTDDALFQLIRAICEHKKRRDTCIDCKKAGTGGG